jgi:penicillin G amidase
LGLARARDWDEFRGALARFSSPAHNFVYADREGHIGWKVAGKVPIRQGRDGRTPARGWVPADAWEGYVPPAELPEAFDPGQGFLATANNHPVPDAWPRDLGYQADAPYRARRIVEELSGRDGWTMEQVRSLQMDVRSAQARELLPMLQKLEPDDPELGEAAALWKGWDGSMTVDSAAAALYEVWLNEVTDVVARHHLGDALYERFAGVHGTFLREVFAGEASALCVQPGVPDCEAAAEIGLGRAVIRLRRTLGVDPSQWRWGELHEIVFHHRLGVTRGLRRKLDARAPAPGNRFTVNVAGYDADSYTQTWHPSYRQVIDPTDWSTATWMFAPGQSGVHYRAHYRDLVDPYMLGEQVPMLFGEAARQKAVRVRTFRRP